jgi:hypothetical protein
MMAIAIANPRRGDRARSMSAPTMGPPTAADAVSEATMYDPVVALPIVAMETTSSAGPAASVADRDSVAVVRYAGSAFRGAVTAPP